jgi:hypothetical protein
MPRVCRCILCNAEVLPKQRVYFREIDSEPLVFLKDFLIKSYRKEEVLKYLELPVIACKGKCQATLKKLGRLRQDIELLEREIEEKVTPRLNGDKQIAEGPSTPTRQLGRTPLDTPTRECISCTVSEGSPCVSVNMKYLIYQF